MDASDRVDSLGPCQNQIDSDRCDKKSPPMSAQKHSAKTVEDCIPKVPQEYCFADEKFLSDSFSVDGFVRRNSRKVDSLEKIKENLNGYLRILKESMIILINEDYTEFINLSANLISFDKSINNIKTPVLKFKNEIEIVRKKIEEIVVEIDSKNRRLRSIRENLKSKLMKADEIFEKILRKETLYLLRMDSTKSLNNHRNDFAIILKEIVNFFLLNNRREDLESIIKTDIVDPFFEKLIATIGTQIVDQNQLEQFFRNVWQFIDTKFFPLISVLEMEEFRFDLVTNTIWASFVEHFISIFSPLLNLTDAETFQRYYLITFQFVQEFQQRLNLSDCDRERFETLTSFLELKSKFKLNVYFHMKLKKISTHIETSFQQDRYRLLPNSSTERYRLQITAIVDQTLRHCWTQPVQQSDASTLLNRNKRFHFGDLFIYAWKLTLKIFSRFGVCISQSNFEEADSFLRSSKSIDQNNETISSEMILIVLIADSQILVDEFVTFYKSTIYPLWLDYFNQELSHRIKRVDLESKQIDQNSLQQSFDETVETFRESSSNTLIRLIRSKIFADCCSLMNQVNDIPRLYRRTNKEKPKEESQFIGKCIERLTRSLKLFEKNQIFESKKLWLNELINDLSLYYKQLTLEVLTSVQKTEDSLRKLKKAKSNYSIGGNKDSNTMSDDNKIRLQIYLDVQIFGEKLQKELAIELQTIKPYLDLLQTVDSLKTLQ
ncbi:conserved oligomeric Golgi complex subunit 2-like protein [Sarcoptes scabiei]|uniref:Conserved oligomeric Golgi complex subunit 2 n=1 Tax=Sarcoptes scabiei TaxID=52283 RepID=A0A132ACH2_SARSC|nr:conserved oligomeric Golgi complex subunit 2-like protein [Sarcoptes scabiei]